MTFSNKLVSRCICFWNASDKNLTWMKIDVLNNISETKANVLLTEIIGVWIPSQRIFAYRIKGIDVTTKVGEFRNKDAISLKGQPSDLCQMFSTTFNTDYKNKDSMNEQGQLLHRAIKIRTCFLEHAHGHFYCFPANNDKYGTLWLKLNIWSFVKYAAHYCIPRCRTLTSSKI